MEVTGAFTRATAYTAGTITGSIPAAYKPSAKKKGPQRRQHDGRRNRADHRRLWRQLIQRHFHQISNQNMASINISVTLDNGLSFNGAATLEDNDQLLAIGQTLADLVRESTETPAPEKPAPSA